MALWLASSEVTRLPFFGCLQERTINPSGRVFSAQAHHTQPASESRIFVTLAFSGVNLPVSSPGLSFSIC